MLTRGERNREATNKNARIAISLRIFWPGWNAGACLLVTIFGTPGHQCLTLKDIEIPKE